MSKEPAAVPKIDELRKKCVRLEEELRQREQDVRFITNELAETNQGVVALYAELDDKAEQLRNASELKSRFLSYMSHEFRTPLGSIRSISRLLIDEFDGPLNAEQRKQVAFIQGSAVELMEMVNDLLDLAKIEAGRITVSAGWFEMVDLFSALRGMFKPLLISEKLSLIFEEPNNVPKLYTDHMKLSQILRNLISNALKFTRSGEIRVSARSVENDRVIFAVADTGIGIDPDHHHAIFEDFVQVDSPIQRRIRGTGLGLALSRKFARLLGGDISVESQLGIGSIFSVTLPVHLGEGRPIEPSTDFEES